MIYLASPYSHPDANVRESRYQAACRASAQLMRAGKLVFSPIAHSHGITRYGLPEDWAFWKACDRKHLENCDEVVVLMLDGWRESIGVQAEIAVAGQLGKPVSHLDPLAEEDPGPGRGRCSRLCGKHELTHRRHDQQQAEA